MHFFSEDFFHNHIEPFVLAILLVAVGFLAARLLSSSIAKSLMKQLTPQQSMLLKRFIFYFVFFIFIASAFDQLGFHVGALLGAAGILTVAIGIASQTSMSNIVSGAFMIGEKPFEVGHTIKVGDIQGEILSIDLLSVKLRTQENTMVRIPNEMLIKSPITNLSSFPIRRTDLKIGVAYKEDLEVVKDVLFEVAYKNPLSLIEPKPVLQILEFGESSINLLFSVWSSRHNFLDLKNIIQIEIHKAFNAKKIEMSYPSRSLYSGSGSEPFPIKIISE
ncbi:MAG: mechanosensitive ion channel family protein [Pseudomonadota bacterium]